MLVPIKMRLGTLIIITLLFSCQSDKKEEEAKSISYSDEVRIIFNQMDSILRADSINDQGFCLESRRIGEGGTNSSKYSFYTKLLETADTSDLYRAICDTFLLPAIRAYSYMAYTYRMDSLKLKERETDCNFKIKYQIGCLVTEDSFDYFKRKVARKRGLNNPYPKKILPYEMKIVREENKIREEQNLPKRKE